MHDKVAQKAQSAKLFGLNSDCHDPSPALFSGSELLEVSPRDLLAGLAEAHAKSKMHPQYGGATLAVLRSTGGVECSGTFGQHGLERRRNHTLA